MNNQNFFRNNFLKPCMYALFAGCIGTNAFALNGPTVTSDCGQQRIQPEDDFSQLLYQPGDLPSPSMCQYPNVGLSFFTSAALNIAGPNRLIRQCSGSLIHIDNNKAVFLSAGHCTGFPSAIPPPWYITFEPQPEQPYALQVIGRDFALSPNNVLKAEGVLTHPLYTRGSIGSSYDVALLIFDNTNGQVSNFNITPLRIPDNPNYLDTVKGADLNKLTWMGVGYADSERPIGNDPDATVSQNFKERRLAQHNRTYAPLDFYSFGKNIFGYKMDGIFINQQTNAGRDGICNGDSGSPLIINNDLVIGVASFVSGVGGNPTPGFCDLKAAYSRTDSPENHSFIKCATDPNKTAAEALQCPHL